MVSWDFSDVGFFLQQNIHTPEVKAFLASDNATYHSVKLIKPDQQVQEDAARNTAL